MMALRVVTVIALLVCSCIILSYNGVYGGRTAEEEEDLELERQLKQLNKPAVKTIKTKHGEIYDCVDFYKQPAFDNPLLKNHIPKMSSSILRETPKEASSLGLKHLGLPGGGCPLGTVPIRRTTKEDLKRWKLYSNSSGDFHQFSTKVPPTHIAGFALKDENLKYHGGSTFISLHNPSLYSPNQYSGALLWAQGGQEQIQVGWHVNPKLYGDNKTHFFGYWTKDNSKATGCFNALCSGFVQVDRTLALGQVIDPTSVYGGDVYVVNTLLFQQRNDGRWWIAAGTETTDIGYWPKELFSSIRESAPVVGWRGEVYAPQGERTPPMGTGDYKICCGRTEPDLQKTAYFRAIRVYGDDYIGRGPNDASLQYVTDGDKHYFARDFPYINDWYRHSIFYAGLSP